MKRFAQNLNIEEIICFLDIQISGGSNEMNLHSQYKQTQWKHFFKFEQQRNKSLLNMSERETLN